MTEEESRYVAELARMSSTSVSITIRIIDIQMAMLLRDLGVKGEAQTLLGKVKINGDGNLSIENPNQQIKNMLSKKFLVDRLISEIGS